MRLMKIKYPHEIKLIDRLNTCLKMCCIPHITFDDGDCFTTYIDNGKCTWEQVITEVNRVHPGKFEFEYESDVYIEDRTAYFDFRLNRKLSKIKDMLRGSCLI